ncbi:MAG: DMT family transporter [Gammaproteobacteria bacterium]|jgi:drug/metabolite transporter (DMT)-like permease|nr:DMT family transporter [Gammaproteobacteria bacterium]MBT4606873.1 DMT family transporter [Thiotrichales bacterium]MBT3473352.1 DMT family transporter [Gammaproteobacteria bacterium]MBT3967400.1 DMT family transporter [Gammaproteobacteria bacterium]MBT4080761.1 DMT family transporter [Gammaproteobacteria bacterium]
MSRSALRWGILSAVLATLIWSWNFIIARSLIDSTPPVTLAFLRWSTAILLLLPFTWRSVRQSWPLARSNLRYLLITALLGVTLFNTLIYIGSQTTSALNLSLISITFPVFIVIFSALFLGRPITLRRTVGIAWVLVGILFLTTNGAPMQLLQQPLTEGDLWMLVAAILFAIYSILVRYKPKGLSNRAFLSYTFLLGWTLLTPWMIWEQTQVPWPEITTTTAGGVLYLGLFTSIASYFFWTHAVDRIGPSNAGMIYYTLPLFSGVEAWLVLGEPITLIHLLSAVAIITGILLSSEYQHSNGDTKENTKENTKGPL